MFYIGCPLWGYKEWLGNFMPAHTPAGDFLRVYSRKLTAVEGNTVFAEFPHLDQMELHGLPSTVNSAEISQGSFQKASCSKRFNTREGTPTV